MSAAPLLLPLPVLHALGWALLHSLWQGLAIAMVLACALWALRGRSPQARYLACCAALLLTVTLPCVTFAWLASEVRAMEAPRTVTMAIAAIQTPAAFTGHADGLFERLTAMLDRLTPWMPALWFAGVLCCMGRLGLGLALAERMKTADGPAIPQAWQQQFERLKTRMQIDPMVKLVSSAGAQTPLVVGWLRPMVVISVACLAAMPMEQIEAILAHELAHIRRGDYLANVLQSLAETIFFYHPAVWWISKQMRSEREYCCDDMVVTLCEDRLAYARALTTLAAHGTTTPALAPGANGGVLTMRIQRILGLNTQQHEHTARPAVSRTAALTLCALTVAAGVCLGAAYAQPILLDLQTTASADAQVQALPPAYRKWLTEDVVWLITPAERTSFLALKSDQDRDRFIAQFWTMRNPNPDARKDFTQKFDAQRAGESAPDTNAFRAEHYRRIAYANMHFRTDGEAGWQTDRGHIYIVYGPPQSIDAHPAGSEASAKPFEVWHYVAAQIQKQNDTDFTFSDSCNCGDYKLSADEHP